MIFQIALTDHELCMLINATSLELVIREQMNEERVNHSDLDMLDRRLSALYDAWLSDDENSAREMEPCYACGATGKCQNCDGQGEIEAAS